MVTELRQSIGRKPSSRWRRQHGRSDAHDLVNKTHINLLRRRSER